MRAVKGNKEYTINEGNQKNYQDMGFDILDDDGKILAYGRGKTVPYGDYMALKDENDQLKAKVAELEAAAETVAASATKSSSKKAGA
jgi:hypothetical protein